MTPLALEPKMSRGPPLGAGFHMSWVTGKMTDLLGSMEHRHSPLVTWCIFMTGWRRLTTLAMSNFHFQRRSYSGLLTHPRSNQIAGYCAVSREGDQSEREVLMATSLSAATADGFPIPQSYSQLYGSR
jgi:hypothetical protein